MKRPLCIAYVITELNRGGAERVLARLVRGLDRRLFEPAVASLGPEGVYSRELRAAGVEVVDLDARRNRLGWFPALVGWLRRRRPALVHGFLHHGETAARLAGFAAGVPRVLGSVQVTEVDRPARWAIERLTRWAADGRTCVAEAVERFVRRRSGGGDGFLRVLYNGVDVPPSPPPPPPGPPMLAVVARLHEQKGIDVGLRAFRALLDTGIDARLAVAGGGPLRGELEALATDLRLGERARFLGEIADIAPLLRDAALLLHPSRWEGCPLAVLDAMAWGRPVAATAVGGVPEIVEHGATGLLCRAGDAAALAANCRAILDDPARARAMGEAGRRRIAERFGAEAMVRAHERLYLELICRGGRA